MCRILSWDHKNQECWIPASALGELRHLSTVNGQLSTAEGIEMLIHQWWAIASSALNPSTSTGDSARLRFLQPESRIQSEHPWPAPWISKITGNSAFYLTNAVQLLNQPGEWYLNTNSNVYFIGRAPAKTCARPK